MTFSKALAIATLTFGTSVGAFAQSATPYHYGMNLDIARVIAVDAPANTASYASTATLTYRDSHGKLQKISYLRPTTSANQN
ncbi:MULTISPECIES: DUF2790 domain-containing protein [Pseudomonas]|uniref:DUF2790 domain-containing protein n=2 Tax=Pseudomonas TaxID=286 RepID=A0AAX0VXA4_9PSED|nr:MULTISPECIES: DUF2790 domain-containing protein [Pseudomonas]MCO7621147.1 DUF2790 domain-containing protein [Pseudomonas guariconensis]MDM9593368.1 DUF2790 domain-containing protein [Pseudomonas guariconensis]MDM9606195.1 DUF2790 domain-containing protein [Pseudomonas guariconensis]MDM9611152.1 DUF2790 domain-containing protein [Pseudomonas guariconensis]MEB3840194.1 DUF2790 domain-containing protein [Pseudomonas guariconensis]